MRKILALVLVFLTFQSCSLFVTDVTEGIRAGDKLTEQGLNLFDSFKALIEQSNLTEGAKAKLLDDLKNERIKFTDLSSELRKYIESFGSVDYQKLAQDLYALYRNRNKVGN